MTQTFFHCYSKLPTGVQLEVILIKFIYEILE